MASKPIRVELAGYDVRRLCATARACNGKGWPLDFYYDAIEEGWKEVLAFES